MQPPRLKVTVCVLLLLATWSSCPVSSSKPTLSCGEVREGAEKGIVRPPQFPATTDSFNCSWIFRAAPGFKLLVRVDNVEFAPAQLRTSLLRLTVDAQTIEIGRNCVDCLESLVAGEELGVQFLTTRLTADSPSDGGVGSFQIRYKAFNPNQCERPRSPNQGYVFGRDWRLGRQVTYHCNPPYDLLGSSTARCAVPDGNLVPEWNRPPPRCALSDCRKGPVRRVAGAGAIASPGFNDRKLPAHRRCQWDIQAEPGHRIKAAFTRLWLPEQHQSSGEAPHLYLFDGDEKTPLANLSAVQIEEGESPLNVTTVSNRLLVVLLTGSGAERDALVYMEYAADPGTCPNPGHPVNGDLVAYSLAVGSSVAFRCKPGYLLTGESRAQCLPTGTWSASLPDCVPLEQGAHQNVAVNVHVEDVGQEDLIGSIDATPAPLGGPRGFTLAPNTNPTSTTAWTTQAATPLAQDVVVIVTTKPTKTSPPVFKSTTKATSTVRPVFPEASEEELDPVPHLSSHKPLLKEDRNRWRPHQQDIHVHPGHSKAPDQDIAAGSPRKPFAHLDPGFPHEGDHDGGHGADDDAGDSNIARATTSRDQNRHRGVEGVQHDDDGDYTDGLTVTMVAVIVAVSAPLAIALLLLIVIVLYRRKYPVRMAFGRKFSTFENPMYVKKDAQDPRELARLSAADKDRF